MRPLRRRLRGRVHVLLVAAAAAGAAGCAASAQHAPVTLGGGPRALVRDPVRDFGTVEPGTPVVQRFQIANVGDQTLDILALAPSCGCTATLVTDPSVAPGQVGAVEVAFDTAGLSGRQAKAVRLRTNDPGVTDIELTVHGEIAADVRVEPARVFLGRIDRNDVAAAVVHVVLVDPAVSITDVTSESGQLDVSMAPLDGPDRGVRLVVVPRTNGQPGRFSDTLVVATTGARQPRVEIPVLASVERGARRSAAARSGGTVAGTP